MTEIEFIANLQKIGYSKAQIEELIEVRLYKRIAMIRDLYNL